MKRRDFSLAAASAAMAGSLAPGFAAAQGARPVDGKDFLSLDKPAPVATPKGRVEVVEFFWYSCPHCNAFEPKLEEWIKRLPKDVTLRRVPVAFRDSFVPEQRLFYALEAMGRLGDLHRKVFYTVHVERQPLNTQELVIAWIEKQGVDRAKFLEQYNSFSVGTKARQAAQLQDAYGVAGVPALGVAGRFYTDGERAGNMDRALQVVDFLVTEARKSA